MKVCDKMTNSRVKERYMMYKLTLLLKEPSKMED